MTDVLETEVVLVGEEVGQTFVRLAPTRCVAPGREPLVEGVRPVLDSEVALVVSMPCVRDVAGGVDARHSRLEVVVDHDPVVDPDAQGGLSEVHPGHHADADHDDVRDLDPSISEHDLLDTPRTSELAGPLTPCGA